jgi:hypothetical protein
MYLGRVICHLMMLTNYYLGFDLINDNMDKIWLIDSSQTQHEEKARAKRLVKLKEIIQDNNKKDLKKRKVLDVNALRKFLSGTSQNISSIDTC